MASFTPPADLMDRPLADSFDAEAFREHCRHVDAGERQPASCDLCYTGPMLADLRELWGTTPAGDILWSMQDGYGVPGFMPEQGYDWSGIRDSTPATIRAMWLAVHA